MDYRRISISVSGGGIYYKFDCWVLIILLAILLFSDILEASPSVDVPLRHWAYDAIEKLAVIGLCDIADIGARPVSRIKMAYIIKSAIFKAAEYDKEFEWREQEYLEYILSKLIEEFREELTAIGVSVVSITDKSPDIWKIKVPSELEIEKLYAHLNTKNTLLENKNGWRLDDGFNARVVLNGWARIGTLGAVYLAPGIRYGKDDTDIHLENGYIRFTSGPNTEYTYGRSPMWWGPGFHGALLMTDNAFPMDIFRVNNIYPFRLPGILRKLGRFNGIFFVSRLEKNRIVPHAWLSGWRLDYTPLDFMKFGFGHILMFGGKGIKKLGLSNFFAENSLVFSPAGGETETENHIISGDMQLFIRRLDRWLPFATGVKLYTEWGAEDEAGNIPVDLASITGAYITDAFKIPGFDFKVEFAKLHKIWYTHFRYSSGYTHRGEFIGHHAGGDSSDLSISVIFNFPESYTMDITFSHQKRGLSQSLVETINELRFRFSLQDALNLYNIKGIEMEIFYEMEDIDNYKNALNDFRNHIIGIEMIKKF